MGEPFVGEIRMFAGNFAPAGWAFCQGQTVPISQNETLFNLIGTTYGGDGQETFNLPDLQGRLPLHQGTLNGITYQIGEQAGTETVTLSTQQIPAHNHVPTCQTTATAAGSPNGGTWATTVVAANTIYSNAGVTAGANFNPAAIQSSGGSQPHENMMPYLCISFIISLFGVFPTQT